jgi:hypothetical protein
MARTIRTTPGKHRRRASIAAKNVRQACNAGARHRATSPQTVWTTVTAIVATVAAVLNFLTATVHVQPTSPSTTTIVVVVHAPIGGCATGSPSRR